MINAFVGGIVGIERVGVPLIGVEEFEIASTTLVVSFFVSFGVVGALANYGATYVERPPGQALFSDISSSGIGAVICPAFQRGRGPLASMKFATRGADQSDAL